MAFIIDKEVLKSGLIIFRRGDVEHRNFYCRIKLPKEDRYKTISLHTSDRESGRDRAFDKDADIRFRVKHDVAVLMNFAITKRFVPASHRFKGRPKLKTVRRDEFTIEEYRKLRSVGRKWIRAATTPQGTWYHTICYNFMLIMSNTVMRPPESASNWQDAVRDMAARLYARIRVRATRYRCLLSIAPHGVRAPLPPHAVSRDHELLFSRGKNTICDIGLAGRERPIS